MIRLDSLRLRLPAEATRLDVAALASHPETRQDYRPNAQRPQDSLTLGGSDFLGFGFGRLRFCRLAGSVLIDASARCLGNEYGRGVTLDTVELAAAALSCSGFLDVTTEAILDADVTRADAFVNVPVGLDNLNDDFAALRTLRTHPAWPMKENGWRPSTSLRWTRSGGEKLRAYDKGTELASARSRDFARTLSRETQRAFSGVIRVEREAQGNARSRALASVAVHGPFATLRTVLESTRPAVAETFGGLRRPALQRELFDRSERYAEAIREAEGWPLGTRLARAVLERFGLSVLCTEANGELDTLKDWARRWAGSKAYRLYPEIEACVRSYHAGPDAQQRGRLEARLDTFTARLRDLS
ncbi:hypothetical protein [Rubrivirga sp.]|uniref:hypothetical protein n=1 Tax=Rubrivirga sp. TaxID=1885344 RepID=UPI003C7283EB